MGKVQVETDIPQIVNYVATTVSVGSTTTLAAGSNATVTNSGTNQNAVLDFGIPRGKSAYEQAVEGGYAGSEDDFKAALASDIGTVATNISDVNSVGQSIADVNNVADNLTDISTVATNVSDVGTVAGISSDVSQVAGIASAVSNVSANESNVTLVSDNMASVMTTAGSIGDVNTVAGISSAVSTVASNNSNITAVAADLTNIDTAVTNMAAITAAPTYASNAATSATNAQTWAEGTDVQVAALGGTKSSKGWAARAEELVQSIGQVMRYKGSVATYADLPSTGQETGDVYNVLADDSNYAWTGSAWDMIGSSVDTSNLQPKTLVTPITVGGVSQTTVEGALGAINTNTDGALKNKTTASNSLNILGAGTLTDTNATAIGISATQKQDSVAVGYGASCVDTYSVALGRGATARQYCVSVGYGASTGSGTSRGIAIGYSAKANAAGAIQIGQGTNATASTFQVYSYPMLDDSTGKIPAARLTDMVGADGVNAGTAGAVPAPAATDNTKFLRGDGTWAEAGGGSVSSPTLTWYTGQTGTTLTILDTSAAVCVKVYKNGVLLQPTQDYSISGTTLTLTTALVATDKIIIEDSTMLDGSSLSNVVRSDDVAHIVKCTQAEYDALVLAGTVSATTFYLIVG